jgi:hypothetical protein
MDNPGAFYAITLNTPELRQTLTRDHSRRGPRLASRLAAGVCRSIAYTLRALASRLDAPQSQTNAAPAGSARPSPVPHVSPAGAR